MRLISHSRRILWEHIYYTSVNIDILMVTSTSPPPTSCWCSNINTFVLLPYKICAKVLFVMQCFDVFQFVRINKCLFIIWYSCVIERLLNLEAFSVSHHFLWLSSTDGKVHVALYLFLITLIYNILLYNCSICFEIICLYYIATQAEIR